MKHFLKTFILFYVLITAFVSFGMFASPEIAFADDSANSSKGLTVLPAKFELVSLPGKTIQQSLKIINNDNHDYIYAISLDNISTVGEEGEIIIGGDSQPKTPSMMSSWITFNEPSGIIEANKIKIINFTIEIPDGVETGGKYVSIVISADRVIRNLEETGASARVVSLAMVTIAGDINDYANITSFTFERDDSSYNFIARIRNNGSNHIKPIGTIVVTDIFGRKVDEISIASENILPGSVRKITTKWSRNNNLFGIYTATIAAKYGYAMDKSFNTVHTFSIFPLKYTIPMFVLLAIIIWVIIATSKKIIRNRFRTKK